MRVLAIGAMMALSLLPFVSTPASAAVVYNTSLAPPGVYYGTGNAGTNTGWTADINGVIDLALGVIERYMGAEAPTATNVYNVPLGNTTVPGKQGSWWGFRFSAMAGSGLLGDYTFEISVADVKHGNTVLFDPMAIPDNAGSDGTLFVGGSNGCAALPSDPSCAPSTRKGMQNAETLSFVNGVASVFDPMYDANEDNTWFITFSAHNRDQQLVSSTQIIVNAGVGVPEPTSIALLAAGLFALACIAYTRPRGGTGNGGGGAANDNDAQPAAA